MIQKDDKDFNVETATNYSDRKHKRQEEFSINNYRGAYEKNNY